MQDFERSDYLFSPYNLKKGKKIDFLEVPSGIWTPPFSASALYFKHTL
jgi:hypothetical protein